MNLSSLLFAFTTAIVLGVGCDSASIDGFSSKPFKYLDKLFINGNREILASNLSESCTVVALNRLTILENESEKMSCNNTWEIMSDVYKIGSTGFDSLVDLIVDMNTVANGIPLCVDDKTFWDTFEVLGCIARQFTRIWGAVKDFWNYAEFYRPTIRQVNELTECIRKKNQVAQSVANIVKLAKLCS